MLTQIKFGTSGWRAVMAEEFTFANVQRAVGGIARYVASQKRKGARVIVGRDPRWRRTFSLFRGSRRLS
jgi:phosphoglucomutase